MKLKQQLDFFEEDFDFEDLNELDELNNNDGLNDYYEDYNRFEADLTQLIKEKK